MYKSYHRTAMHQTNLFKPLQLSGYFVHNKV